MKQADNFRPNPGRKQQQERQQQIAEINQQFTKIRRQASDGKRLMAHLDVFNDAVIAIIITIMVLEVPLPIHGEGSYPTFLSSVLVFLISFLIVANFWYEHHRNFALFKEIDKFTLVLNFLFLGSLSLVPLLTKWIMQDPSKLAIINYGLVYLIVNLLELLIFRSGIRAAIGKSNTTLLFTDRLFIFRIWWLFILNGLLILLSFKWPQIAMILYLSLPISSFIFSTDNHSDKPRRNK